METPQYNPKKDQLKQYLRKSIILTSNNLNNVNTTV